MTDDSWLTGDQNATLFTLLGVAAVVAGVTYFGGWVVPAFGIVIVAGGVGSLLASRVGWSQRKSAVPMVISGFVLAGLLVWQGYQRGTVFWPTVGVGMVAALVLLRQFPTRQEFSWATLTVTFGGAGLWLVAQGTLTGLVMTVWGVVFARETYQNRPTADD